MTGHKKVFLDSSPIIYFLDNDENFSERTIKILDGIIESGAELITSAITCEEYLVYAYRANTPRKRKAFYDFLDSCHVKILPISIPIADRAAQMRAEHKGFKTMDALQLAAAVTDGCDMFLTNDKQLKQFNEIPVLVLDDF